MQRIATVADGLQLLLVVHQLYCILLLAAHAEALSNIMILLKQDG